MMKTLTIIGCGKVGRTLAGLWKKSEVFSIGQVLNRSLTSAMTALDFIGEGKPVKSFGELRDADLFMITTSDDSIEECCCQLSETGLNLAGKIVFHCSGSLSSNILDSARQRGAFTASVHPVKSFADVTIAYQSFNGTYCAIEGDSPAREVLEYAFGAIGAKLFEVDPSFKTIYHAAAVFVCNYLVALMEAGLQCYEKAGVSREIAMEVIQPIVQGTVDNFFQLGQVHALTGPIARGETEVIKRQLGDLTYWNPELAQLYKDLGLIALKLSRLQGTAKPEALEEIGKILNNFPERLILNAKNPQNQN